VEEFIERTAPYTDAEPLESVEINLNLADVRLTGKIVGLYPEHLMRYRYARVTAGDRIKVWINHLALNAVKGNQHPGISLLAGLGPERVWTGWKLSPVADSEAILTELLEIYKAGRLQPIHFFPKSSWIFVRETLEKKRAPHEALLKSQTTWIGSTYSRGESEDAYYQLCFKNTSPLDSEFQRVSKKIFGPLLMHQSEIGK
jgi:exodeoxyribonuclease V gamma subunit